MSYWLELLRRSLLVTNAAAFPTLFLFSLTVAFRALALSAFRFFDRIARDKGLIDAQSNF